MPGVYISWPFCAQKCTYCNFASGVFPKELEGRYLERLEREIRETEWPWTPDTVYLGGGTPSQVAPEILGRILDAVPGREWAEATLEAAPGSFGPDAPPVWRRAGINRVSLGVQSFLEGELRKTGRRHTAEVVRKDVATLRAAGFEEINLDLIAGLAGQTEESWEESLGAVLSLDPPHVSVYMLEVDADSRLGLEILEDGGRYGAKDVPGEEAVASMYERAVERLAGAGILRYEISNFARPGSESRHNLKYWRLEEYLGFGADAHSFAGGQRWRNVESARDYVDRASPSEGMEPARPNEERFFVGLRLDEGVQPTTEDWARHGERIGRLVEAGALRTEADRIRLTSRGVLISNEVFQEFLDV